MEDVIKLWMPITKKLNIDGSFNYVGILSDDSIDRYEEFMSKALLRKWANSGVLPALVNHKNEMQSWVGGWQDFKIVEKGERTALSASPMFFSEKANPLASQVQNQVEEAMAMGLNPGISISARGIKSSVTKRGDKQFRCWDEAELLEATWVPIQSNRNAYAIVAKSFDLEDIDIQKPKEVHDCVNSLMNDPDFKPQDGKTKEESAWAVCQAKFGKQCIGDKMENNEIKECEKKFTQEDLDLAISKAKEEANTEKLEISKQLSEKEAKIEELNKAISEKISVSEELETLKKQIADRESILKNAPVMDESKEIDRSLKGMLKQIHGGIK